MKYRTRSHHSNASGYITKAQAVVACRNSGVDLPEHFGHTRQVRHNIQLVKVAMKQGAVKSRFVLNGRPAVIEAFAATL